MRPPTTLDFSQLGRLEPDHLRRLNDIAETCRTDFVRAIETAGAGREQDLDWWVSDLASRNTFSCPLFTWCCQIQLTAALLDEGQSVASIVVDAWPLYRALKDLVARRRLSIRLQFIGTWKSRLAWWPRPPWFYLRYLFEYLYARWIEPNRRWPSRGPRTLVDTFIFDGSFPNGQYADRYYGEFGGLLDEVEWRQIWYWSTLHTTFRNIGAAIRSSRRAARSFVLTEDVVGLADYVFAFLYPLRECWRPPPRLEMAGIDISTLVRAVWWRGLTDSSSIAGLLKYRFAQRLKEQGIEVRRVIDWFENQSIDRGANLGFRLHFPACRIVGYQGYILPRHYMAMYPSQQEYANGVVPHTVAVVGCGFVEGRREFCSDLDVIAAPAFRFAGVWLPRRQQPDPRHTTILVPLHMTIGNSIDVLRVLVGAAAIGLPSNVRLWIRPHPAAPPVNELVRMAGLELPRYENPEGDFTFVLEQADLLVSNTSSTCLEALAKNVPVAVIAAANVPAQNPIPRAVPEEFWRMCYSPADLVRAITDLPGLNSKRRADGERLGERIKADYFCPVTREGVAQLLDLPR